MLMVLEYWYSLKKQKRFYSFDESISNLNVGIVERMCDMFSVSLFYFFFVWVYQNFAIFHIEANVWTWVILFLFTDVLWYWYHRYSHEINLLWAAHVVHHQSEDYNFTVAAGITIFQAVFRSLFSWRISIFLPYADRRKFGDFGACICNAISPPGAS